MKRSMGGRMVDSPPPNFPLCHPIGWRLAGGNYGIFYQMNMDSWSRKDYLLFSLLLSVVIRKSIPSH